MGKSINTFGIGALLLLSGLAASARAAEQTFVMSIAEITEQEPGSRYASAQVGDTVTAIFGYGDTESEAFEINTDLDLDEREWVFMNFDDPGFGATLTHGTTPTSSSEVSIVIQNDHRMDLDEASLFEALIGAPPGSIPVATEIDVWTAAGLDDNAFFLLDEDFEEVLADGVEWEMVFGTRDTTFFDDLSYQPVPPSPERVEAVALLINETDEMGEPLFHAVAMLESSPLAAAVLPVSRAVQTSDSATVFATIINAAPVQLDGCGIAPTTPIAATFDYQTTDPATNELIGTANTPVSIPAGAFQTYVLAFTLTQAVAPTEIFFHFACDGVNPPNAIPGVNTLLLSASDTAGPNVIALAASTLPGQIVLDSVSKAAAFSVSTTNVGVSGSVTVEATSNTGVTLTICETDPLSGTCNEAPVPGPLALAIGAGATPTFGVFAFGDGTPIAFDAAMNRVVFVMRNITGSNIASTSVAISAAP